MGSHFCLQGQGGPSSSRLPFCNSWASLLAFRSIEVDDDYSPQTVGCILMVLRACCSETPTCDHDMPLGQAERWLSLRWCLSGCCLSLVRFMLGSFALLGTCVCVSHLAASSVFFSAGGNEAQGGMFSSLHRNGQKHRCLVGVLCQRNLSNIMPAQQRCVCRFETILQLASNHTTKDNQLGVVRLQATF